MLFGVMGLFGDLVYEDLLQQVQVCVVKVVIILVMDDLIVILLMLLVCSIVFDMKIVVWIQENLYQW